MPLEVCAASSTGELPRAFIEPFYEAKKHPTQIYNHGKEGEQKERCAYHLIMLRIFVPMRLNSVYFGIPLVKLRSREGTLPPTRPHVES